MAFCFYLHFTYILDLGRMISLSYTILQTQKDLRARLRVGSKERLTFFGQVQMNPLHSTRQAIKVKVNFIHRLQVSLFNNHLNDTIKFTLIFHA